MAGDAPPEPLTLAQAKYNLRVDDPIDGAALADQDAFIASLIVTAREVVEDRTGLILTPRTVTEALPSLVRSLDLATWPISAVTGVSYLDWEGAPQPIEEGQWYLSQVRRPARLHLKWSALLEHRLRCCQDFGPSVTVTMAAGYATPDDVPARLKQAMHLLIGTWFVNREADVVGRSAAAVELPTGVDYLLQGAGLVLV